MSSTLRPATISSLPREQRSSSPKPARSTRACMAWESPRTSRFFKPRLTTSAEYRRPLLDSRVIPPNRELLLLRADRLKVTFHKKPGAERDVFLHDRILGCRRHRLV